MGFYAPDQQGRSLDGAPRSSCPAARPRRPAAPRSGGNLLAGLLASAAPAATTTTTASPRAGPLPPSLAQSNIKYLHLGGNALSGGAALPPAVVTANLSSNQLSGELADSVSQDLVSIDVSRNQLSGSVPATLANYKVRGRLAACQPASRHPPAPPDAALPLLAPPPLHAPSLPNRPNRPH
jgi:hypothetical protein